MDGSCGNNCSSFIFDKIKKILILQKQNFDNDNYVGCDKPFLGPTISNVCYNTRPIILYNCSTASPWTFDYTLSSGTTGTTDVLRVESCDDCCCTCRLLYLDSTTSSYVGTNQFVTIDLGCCGAIRCLNDVYIDLC